MFIQKWIKKKINAGINWSEEYKNSPAWWQNSLLQPKNIAV